MGIPKSHLKELRSWMKRTGTSQRTLARVTGIKEPYFSKILSGKYGRHFSADAAGRLAKLTGIPVEKLLTDPNDSRIVKLLGEQANTAA